MERKIANRIITRNRRRKLRGGTDEDEKERPNDFGHKKIMSIFLVVVRREVFIHTGRHGIDKNRMTVVANPETKPENNTASEAVSDALPLAAKTPGKCILIVDDDADTRWLLEHLMANEGYEVKTAEYAEEAIMLLYNFTPDAVLMDVRLPGMDGLQLTRLLKLTRNKRVPILAVSSGNTEHAVQEAYEAGCDGFIAKPVEAGTFASTVDKYLAGR
jgi:two-component system cell cycle response regulator DivK